MQALPRRGGTRRRSHTGAPAGPGTSKMRGHHRWGYGPCGGWPDRRRAGVRGKRLWVRRLVCDQRPNMRAGCRLCEQLLHSHKRGPSRQCIKFLERSRTITSVIHSITVCQEKLGKRDVSRPTCACGWVATWTYVTEKFARDAGQEHVKQVLAQLQAVM